MTVETRPAEVVSAPKVKTTADVLRHAALIIEERGHGRYVYESTNGSVCALGAISLAATGAADREGAFSPEAHYFYGWLRGHGVGGLMSWNDAPGRAAAEVTTALRAAADASERAS